MKKHFLHFTLPVFLLLIFIAESISQTVTRGPYLQKGTPTSIVVRWRTSTNTDSKVWYGSDYQNLTSTITVGGSRTDHEILVSGLTANTTYYYAVGENGGQIVGGDAEHYFITSPTTGSTQTVRMWMLGDAGKKTQEQRDVRDGYYSFIGNNHTDMIVQIGDNAYEDGLDSDFQLGWFENMYEDVLKNTVVWPNTGCHDLVFGANSAYWDIFTMPTNGEAGGEPSGTEYYFSYDYGNVHVISLDSEDSDRSVGGDMLTWLEDDLAANTQDWTIVVYHHAPYVGPGSDTQTKCIQMRENALPILEDAGVDLVLGGHFHNYHRTHLMKGHFGLSNTFDPNTMVLDNGDGRLDSDGAYAKANSGLEAGHGTVYMVSGSAGSKVNVNTSHPADYYSAVKLGSSYIEVSGNQMDVYFLDVDGNMDDYFTISKGTPTGAPPTVNITSPANGAYYPQPQTITINADATDTDGTVVQVNFKANGISVGIDDTAPFSLDWAIPSDGEFVLTAVALDDGNNLTVSAPVSILVGEISTCSQVSASTDDAEERPSGTLRLTSSDLELINDGSEDQTVGMRFMDLNIPQGATIVSANIQFTVDEAANIDPCNLNIYGEDSDDAATFIGTKYNMTDRPLTGATVSWSPPIWPTAEDSGPNQQTADIAPIIQEIVDRANYTSNSAIAIIMSGTGRRTAVSYNGDAAMAPELCVSYELTGSYDCPSLSANIGDPCDDMDVCTIDDEVQPDCSCAGTFQDGDGDGVCDALDVCPGGPEPGTVCDDGDPNTSGEVIMPDCSCAVPDCPSQLANIGDPCDDGDVCTIDDEIQPDCSCVGTFQDGDGDGVCDAEDVCPGAPDPGLPCDDMDVCTTGDEVQPNCSCAGTFQDSDGDGVCDANDLCPGGPEPGTACDDGNPGTSGETIQPDCSCGGGVVGAVTACSQVSASTDDAEERPSGTLRLTSSDLELINDGSENQTVGMRFMGLNIPQGGNIISADIQFTVDEADNIDPCNLNIHGEDSDDATTFTSTNYNMTDRPLTGATVSWSPPNWLTVGDKRTRPANGRYRPCHPGDRKQGQLYFQQRHCHHYIGHGETGSAESFNGSAVKAAHDLCVTY